MKRIIAIALTAVLVVSAGVLSTVHYNDYQNKKQHDAQVAAAQEAEQAAAITKEADDRYETLKAEYNAAVAECGKGKAAYEKLTPTVQKVTPAPVCPAPTAEAALTVTGTVR